MMEFKDYYADLGVSKTASQSDIKRAYRKLARKYHPDVSQEPDAESRFKQVAEAHEALIDPERRAAYDDLALRRAHGGGTGADFQPPPGWNGGYEFSGRGGEAGGDEFSDFFESLFGRGSHAGAGPRGRPTSGPAHRSGESAQGADIHARIEIDLLDAYRGARHKFSLRRSVPDARGQAVVGERQVEVNIPVGVRPGQHLRLAGMGHPGEGGGAAGDLYLEIEFRPQPHFRVEGPDVWTDLAVAPWEAALGATVTAPLPDGEVQLTIPAGSIAGRKLRLKGKGLPGKSAGDLYAVIGIVLPLPDTEAARDAYAAMARAFPGYDARRANQA